MNQQPEYLLETDRLEDVLDEPGPPHPVVVIQYRSRVIPWLILVLMLVLSMGGLLVYNRREAARFRDQALQAKRELERLREAERAESHAPRPSADVRPVASAMSPASAGAADARSILASAGAGLATGPRAVVAAPAETKKPDPTGAPAQSPEEAGPTSASNGSTPPLVPPGPPVPVPPPPARSAEPVASVVTAARDPESPSPFEIQPAAPEGDRTRNRMNVGTTPAAVAANPTVDPQTVAAATDVAAGPGGPAAEPPLPSREETERQIREEAARKQREGDQRLAQQKEDLQTLRDDDRRLFLNELRRILNASGKQAGAEIEELSVRAGRDGDPEKLKHAYRIIGIGRTSQRTKVRQLRALGVSESVILDFLANALDKNLGARNGPRNRNDVWVQAAQRLLMYDAELSRSTNPNAGPRESGGRLPSTRPAGIRQPAATTTRVR